MEHVGDGRRRLEAVERVALVGNDHRQSAPGLEELFAVAEKADGVGKVLEVVAADDPLHAPGKPTPPNQVEETRGVTDDVDLLDQGDLLRWHVALPSQPPQPLGVEDVDDERLVAIALGSHRMTPGADLDPG